MTLTVEEKEIGNKPGDYMGHKLEESGSSDKPEVEPVREISATLTIQDESSIGDGYEMRLHGVHWPRRGTLVMITTSPKFAGIFGLPHLTTRKTDFEGSQKVLNKTLGALLRRKEKSEWLDSSDPYASAETALVPNCEYVVYVQVHQPKWDAFLSHQDDLTTEMKAIEEELRFPTGAPVSKPPPLEMSTIVYSPDCGFILESKGPPKYPPSAGQHLRGLKQEIFIKRIKNWSLVWAIALCGQLLLLRSQMKEASTPSTLSRISHYTVTIILVADLLFLFLALFAASAPPTFPAATLTAFAICVSLGMGFRFRMDIYNVQEPERQERGRERERIRAQNSPAPPPQANTSPSTAPIVTAAGADSLPLPATASRAAAVTNIPIIIPSDQDIDAEIAQVANAASAVPTIAQAQRPNASDPANTSDMALSYGQYMLLLMLFFFLTISSATWPSMLRSIYINTLSLIYLSFWTPQIYRNVMRNCRKAFLWKFVFGQSILRLVPFAYFYLKEDNVLFAETSPITMLVLTGWLWVQIWVLVAQEVLGPRFGLPRGWLPEAWDYHPILREDDTEDGGMPIGLVQAPGSPQLERVKTGEEGKRKSDAHTRSVDCAICMQVIEVPVVPAGEDGASGVAGGAASVTAMLARRLYMVTPCRHVFHSACLEGWMRFRLQCPICRENLPPL